MLVFRGYPKMVWLIRNGSMKKAPIVEVKFCRAADVQTKLQQKTARVSGKIAKNLINRR
jgi:hypothetical protein